MGREADLQIIPSAAAATIAVAAPIDPPTPPPAPTALAPGFRFHPTDEELVIYYLKRKVCRKPFKFNAISEVDIYKSEPWDLADKSSLKSRDQEYYFFSALDRKYGNGARMNRATNQGYWKATGNDRAVKHNDFVVGMKKTLVFHSGRAPDGKRTNWVMHEYRLVDEVFEKAGLGAIQDAFVLCRVFHKSNIGPPNGHRYAPFVEEEWDDDDKLTLVPGQETRSVAVVSRDAFVVGNDHAACTEQNDYAARSEQKVHAARSEQNDYAASSEQKVHAASSEQKVHAARSEQNGHAAYIKGNGHAAYIGGNGHAGYIGGNGHAGYIRGNGHAAYIGGKGQAAYNGENGHGTSIERNGRGISMEGIDHGTSVGHGTSVKGTGHGTEGNGHSTSVKRYGHVTSVEGSGHITSVEGNGQGTSVKGNGHGISVEGNVVEGIGHGTIIVVDDNGTTNEGNCHETGTAGNGHSAPTAENNIVQDTQAISKAIVVVPELPAENQTVLPPCKTERTDDYPMTCVVNREERLDDYPSPGPDDAQPLLTLFNRQPGQLRQYKRRRHNESNSNHSNASEISSGMTHDPCSSTTTTASTEASMTTTTRNFLSALVEYQLLESLEPKDTTPAPPPELNAALMESSVPTSCLKYIETLQTEIHKISIERETLKFEMMSAQAMINILQARIDLLNKENEDLKRKV
ncbi:NAC domain containing protein 50-like isoform X1 [Malus sylvestris]|uniref:NAC domain containing protein 50-like isoform X1 n=1 Tax=Malus domestica TaxID=3750 RepID=UPI0010AA491D|nr:NAC domain containing protein 50-like [Malus domestica]XP_050122733.1 NAC domain containing protein 50-like isoform X1 [Malus sylvestris]